jgi:diadenosine tetraphosphate (Ap4A) HIT family hydrolase
MPHAHHCCLCSQIEGREENDLIARMLPDEPYLRRIMLESASFAVMPSLGPLAPGHSLLCPKAHVTSFARLDYGLHAEYEAIKETLKARLVARYGREVAVFEHGMDASGDRVLCSVDHAHMHFVPLPASLDVCASERARAAEWEPVDGGLATIRRLSAGGEYVYYEAPGGPSWLLASRQRRLESQYMRRVLAAELGRTESWNWREAPDARAAHETWRCFVHG